MKSFLFVTLTCVGYASFAQNPKPTPDLVITVPSNGLAGSTIPFTLDTDGSTGIVTWSVTSRGGAATIVDNNKLSLTAVGSVELKASVVADANYAAASTSKLIRINAADVSNPLMAQIWGTTVDGGAGDAGVLFRMNADGTGYTIMDQLNTAPDGGSPFYNRPMVASDGKIYMTLGSGGQYAAGTLVRFDPSDKSFTTLYQFKKATGAFPSSELLEAPNGLFYGTTNGGGEFDYGTLFSYDRSTGTYTLLHSFDGLKTTGANPDSGPCLGPDGNLYGLTLTGGVTAGGLLYKYDVAAGSMSVVKGLDYISGLYPTGGLRLASNNKMYGITTGGGQHGYGTVFEFDPSNSAFTVKVDLAGTDVINSVAGFSTESADHLLYAVGTFSGSHGVGTIVSYSPGATSVTKLYDFDSGPNDIGKYPYGSIMVASTGKLYTMLSTTSSADYTSVLSQYNPSTGDHTEVRRFTFDDGAFAASGICETADGVLYGMTDTGGAGDFGTFFRYNPSTDEFQKLKDFIYAPNGSNPRGMVQYTDRKIFYTSDGGNGPRGAVQEFNTTTNTPKVKARYSRETGTRPRGFMKHSNGKFYGVLMNDGPNANGTVVEYTPSNGELNVLASFPGYPTLIPGDTGFKEGPDGKIYATGSFGANFNGAIYSFDPNSNLIETVYSFGAGTAEGNGPAGVSLGPDNMFYGVSKGGGANSAGIIYKFDPAAKTFTKLYDFEGGTGGSNPSTWLTLASNGKFYGNALQGGNGDGFVFELDPANGQFTKKINFGDAISETPFFKTVGGKLLGVALNGGYHAIGYIFEYDPATNTLTPRSDLSYENGYHNNSNWVLVKRDQVITFPPTPKVLGDAPSDLGGSTNSQLPLTYTTTSDKISINGKQVTLLKAGRVSVKADQAGDENFNAAPTVETSFCVNPPRPTITDSAPNETGVTLTSSADAGNQWYKEGVKIDGATAKTYFATVVGNYTVQVKADDCLSTPSIDKTLTVVTGLSDDAGSDVRIYPNPVTSELFIEVHSSVSQAQVKVIDLLGRTIEAREIGSNTVERFELAHLKPSMYIVRIAHDGKMMSKVFVKQ